MAGEARGLTTAVLDGGLSTGEEPPTDRAAALVVSFNTNTRADYTAPSSRPY